jgi:hypothetical protein
MPPKKSGPAPAQRPLPAAEPEPAPASAAASSTGRKPWIKRTPIEVVLEQIGKQESRVAEMREDLAKEERELQKLQQAKKVLEAI